MTANDQRWMDRALFHAARAAGRTSPNPLVGAVVVSTDGVVRGQGYHERAGEPHAEVRALAKAGSRARGATLYCTLEPCAHQGRTGPCVPRSLAMISRVFDGQPEGLTRDDVLDNVTLTWLTNTFISGARLYWEDFQSGVSFFGVKGVQIPVAVSVFPDELYQAPRSWAEQAYPKLMHYNRLPKGGHFAAWEQPKLFAEELRAGFRPLHWNR